jgi:hypothetical protein
MVTFEISQPLFSETSWAMEYAIFEISDASPIGSRKDS